MKTFVITLKDNVYSETKAMECMFSGRQYGVFVDKFYGVDKDHAEQKMKDAGLEWTWAKNNTANDVCPITGLHQFPYQAADLRAKIGCSMSHYKLYQKCVELNEPILILEHDAVFLRSLPEIKFNGICQINDPIDATPKGKWWHDSMVSRSKKEDTYGNDGVFEKTWIRGPHERQIPDGLAGNSAYMIKPWAAQELIDKYHEIGVWPNDAILCKQIFSYLEEYYPFITKVNQTQSTTVG